MAAIAIGLIAALVFLGVGVRGLFESTAEPVQQAPFQPPVPSSELTWPTSLADCEDGGWRNYPQFDDKADCVEYVEDLTP